MDDYELFQDIDIYKKSNVDSLQSRKLPRRSTLGDFINIYNPRGSGHPSVFKEYYDDYKDYDFLNHFSDIRKVRDQFTDGYVATFFDTRDATFQFIHYMYQTTYFNILANINRRLTTEFNVNRDTRIGLEPLQYYEYLKMAFKGGTNMNVIFNDYLNMLRMKLARASAAESAKINASIGQLTVGEVTSKFAISDTDMSLDIITVNIKRHKQIQYCASLCILEAMTAIRTNLDMMWNSEYTNISDISRDPNYTHRTNMAPPAGFAGLPTGIVDDAGPVAGDAGLNFDTLKHEIEHAKEAFYTSGLVNPTEIINLLNRYNIGGNIGSQNMIVCGLLIELLGHLEYYVNSNTAVLVPLLNGLNINNMRDRLFECAKHKNHLLFENIKGMYNSANKARYNTSILNKLQSLQINHPSRDARIRGILQTSDILYELKQGNSLYCRVVETPITEGDNITFEPREDFILRMQDIPMSNYCLHETMETPHYHYLSYNTTIFNKFDEYTNDFVLFRIKLNGKVMQLLQTVDTLNTDIANIHDNAGPDSIIDKNAPSEILDVTISAHYDGQKILKPEPFQIKIINNEPIYAYTTLSLVYDLGYILFRQIYYCPWSDGKYDKRIFRYMFLLTLHYDSIDKQNNNNDLVSTVIKPLFNMIMSINISNPVNIRATIGNLNAYGAVILQNNFYNNVAELLKAIKTIQISSIYMYNEEYKHINLIADSLFIWLYLIYGDGPGINNDIRTEIIEFIYSKMKNIYRGNDILDYTRGKFGEYIDKLKLIVIQLRNIFDIAAAI
jgi:hypothetical protein